MTYRERLERKLARRKEWAEKRKRQAEQLDKAGSQMASVIPLGQPILIGHHSEKRDRAYRERIRGKFEKAHEAASMATHHQEKAEGLERQLDGSIFSDDPDALESLEARIAELTQEADHMKAVNAAFRKAPGTDNAAKLAEVVKAGLITGDKAISIARSWALMPYLAGKPYQSYTMSNLRANIGRLQKRIKNVKRRQTRQAEAEAAPGGIVIKRYEDSNWCSVTFAEKPEWAILDALRAAEFQWGGGYWSGTLSKLPECVAALMPPQEAGQ